MDLAIYISELIGQRGELQIPRVGHFAQKRVNGYYNGQEDMFYPPGNQVCFDTEVDDNNEVLAGYIANKKNISLLSAKYFVDKYIDNLKVEVLSHNVQIGELGYLFTENGQLLFKAGKIPGEAGVDFYGFKPIKLYRNGQQEALTDLPVIEDIPGIITPLETVYTPQANEPEKLLIDEAVSKPQVFSPHGQDQQHLQYMEDEIKKPNLPVIILFVVTIVGLILFGIYLYNPNLFGGKHDNTTIVKPVDNPNPKPIIAPPSADTTKKSVGTQIKAPVTVATPPLAAAIDTMSKKHYELLGGAFKTDNQINVAIKNYESLGLKPRILKRATGRLYKITLGTYFSKIDAIKAQDSISKATKIRKTSILIQPINPKL